MAQAVNTSQRKSLAQVIFSFFYLLIFPVVLFLLAGDWSWAEGWLFSIVFCSMSLATVIYLYLKDPALLNERFGSPFQKAQKSWDKFLIPVFFVGFLVWYAIMPLDARRYHWSRELPAWLEAVGLTLFLVAFFLVFGALKENSFAAPVVKMQKERGQRVISSGLYGIVRHPMYTGGALLFVSGPLLLGSIYGLVLGFVLGGMLAVRSLGEEQMLKSELPGYNEYTQRVRWRLIPFVF
jgi:protein-S-isoprenylcysteine O-methyltransferase Ste14